MSNYNHKFLDKTYQFGPFIYHCQLDPEFIKEFLRQGELATGEIVHEDGSKTSQIFDDGTASSLVKGHERQFTPSQQRWFNKSLKDVFHHYTQMRFNFHSVDFKPDYVIENVWINYQHANEYQPDHIHSGDFSWVIYCEIPEGLEEERNTTKKKGPQPGSISFGYGEFASNPEKNFMWSNVRHSIIPNPGDMIIFPAQMRHFVPPFKCDGIRISGSGNGVFYMPDQKLYHMGDKRY
jgi:hypothetical protein|tara:strand:+ start:839 stop:1546 length:708 start_codon:yes stop_codon:yes gene_type:complete